MHKTKHNIVVLVALLTVTGMAAASLAHAGNNWRQVVITHNDTHNPQVCIDNLYRITHCQLTSSPLTNNRDDMRLMWHSPLYSTSTVPSHLLFSLKKGHCRHKMTHKRPSLLQTLFSGIPDLKLELARFAVNVEVPSNFNEFNQSTIHLGFRNCW